MNIPHNLSRRLIASLSLILPLATPALADNDNVSYDSASRILTISGDFTSSDITLFSEATSVKFADTYASATIPDDAFSGFSITAITIPDVVTTIGKKAFYGCASLKKVILSYNLETIGESAFQGCSSLTTISLPPSLITISDYAFYETKLKDITILPDCGATDKHIIYLGTGNTSDATSTGTCIFPNDVENQTLTSTWNYSNVDNFSSFNFTAVELTQGKGWYYDPNAYALYLYSDDTNTQWSGFTNTIKYATRVVFTNTFKCTSIPSRAFYSFSYLESISIPEGVTSIGENAFSTCDNLASVTLPSSTTSPLTSIGASAFSYCSALKSISLPKSVSEIGESAFTFSGLESIGIPEGVTEIGQLTFCYCSKLSEVTLPSTLKTIGMGAFALTGLTSITLPASLNSIGDAAFTDCDIESVEILYDETVTTPHVIYLGSNNSGSDEDAYGSDIFTCTGATLTYNKKYTNVGHKADDGMYTNLLYYFPGSATSLQSPTIGGDTTARYYDLGGRPVSPASHHGIAVRTDGSRSSLTLIK